MSSHDNVHVCVPGIYQSERFTFTIKITNHNRGFRGRDHMVVGFTITYVISAYHH